MASRRHTLFDRVPLDVIDFATGGPSSELLPTHLFALSSQLAFSDSQVWGGSHAYELRPDSILQYGPELGDSVFIDLLASFLSRRYITNIPVLPESLAVTPGASIGLLWALMAFTNAPERNLSYTSKVTRAAFLPLPTYHLVFQTFADMGFAFPGHGHEQNVIGVPEDEDGILVDVLEEKLRELGSVDDRESGTVPSLSRKERTFQFVLYLVPSHSNPSGTTVSASRRDHLIRLSREFDMLIICDDVYELLYYPDSSEDNTSIQVPDRLVAYDMAHDGGGYVISNSSFSKILGPGVRCGWLEAHPSLIEKMSLLGAWYSGGGTAALANRLIIPLIADSALPYLKSQLNLSEEELSETPSCALDHHINHICRTYGSRLKAMLEGTDKYLMPLGIEKPKRLPKGGYFLWLRLPPHLRSLEAQVRVKEIAREEKVLLHPGSTFVFDRRDHVDSGYIRLCWAYNNEEQIMEGCRRMAKAFERLQ